ncbi:uncharacterized protein [Amphiura filiformis]|uniref:uncharacterized protein n=1 Tax=Amphiura filiformis TaxID=82378 RepID=UPI003B222E4C
MQKCLKNKLSNEFPPTTLRDDCDHAPLHCLRCVTNYWEKQNQCSQCNKPVDKNSLTLRKCYSQLQSLFPEIKFVEAASSGASGKITIARLDGDSRQFPYSSSTSIVSLKEQISQPFGVEAGKQSLLYGGKELQNFMPDNSLATLSTWNVKPNSTIHLMVLLVAVAPNLNKVVFDLYWGYPSRGQDYLDASALVYNGKSFVGVVDYHRGGVCGNAITHSGDIMDSVKRQGHHLINVELHSIPNSVTHVFFTLSAYNSPTISHFPNPSLRFFDKAHPDQMLCADQTKKAGHRQAIVMCCLSRKGGQWFVHDTGALSNGNAMNYDPLKATITTLLNTGI